MTTITAEIVADSVSADNTRLTTMKLRYPRWIHSEFMTHRVFSRNASSSRAVPVARLIQDVMDDPALPLYWGMNQKGMQAAQEDADLLAEFCAPPEGWKEMLAEWKATVPGQKRAAVAPYWLPIQADGPSAYLQARDRAVEIASAMAAAGWHKQLVNRLLEPFSHISVVVTATEWSNFYALRCHPDAEPHMRMLAEAMRAAQEASTPFPLHPGEWHMPFVQVSERTPHGVKLSVARCARVSYLTHEGRKPSVMEDFALHERLVGSVPLHASPAEHQATPDPANTRPELHGNFTGWIQYRKTLPNESA